jgi:hypothetical protein
MQLMLLKNSKIKSDEKIREMLRAEKIFSDAKKESLQMKVIC